MLGGLLGLCGAVLNPSWGSPELQPGHSAQPPILLPQSHHPNVPVAPHCSSGQHWARATHEETIRAGISPCRAVPLEVVAAVLKLGNIEFKPESRVNGLDESKIKDKNGKSAENGPCLAKLALNLCPVFNIESKTCFLLS